VNLPKLVTWDADIVTNEVMSCVKACRPPPQVIVGSDAKYVLLLLRMIPVWILDFVDSFSAKKVTALK